ncbi:hypothetical protein [Deinococcus indicus]|uniref:hypothetical protein n=1 Tax=Deinococcus indicus TaxID=223556 RepID=UPI00174B1105|nr:hypothetical protein [Deinococcus indicus]
MEIIPEPNFLKDDNMKTTHRKIHLKSALLGVGLTAGVGFAATQVSSLVPHVFSAGTPIKASEINANFAALAQGVQDAKANGLPTQSGQAGAYLKTDGTNASWAAAPGTTVQVRANKVGGTGEALSVSQPNSVPALISFPNQLTGPAAGTGNTWDGSTFTVGASGAGLYYVQAHLLTIDNATPSNTVGVQLIIELNGASYGSASNMYGVYPTVNGPNMPSGVKGRGMINYMIYLNAGDSLKIKGLSANSSQTTQLAATAGSNLLIARLN